MPRPITPPRWGCNFKCGRVSPDKKLVEKHELTCFKNPARRACKTCKHDCISRCHDCDDAFDQWCAVDARPEGVNAMADCSAWEPK
jgi:hypothetical protein